MPLRWTIGAKITVVISTVDSQGQPKLARMRAQPGREAS